MTERERCVKIQMIDTHIRLARDFLQEGKLWINALYELQQAKEVSDTLIEQDKAQLNLPLREEEKNNG